MQSSCLAAVAEHWLWRAWFKSHETNDTEIMSMSYHFIFKILRITDKQRITTLKWVKVHQFSSHHNEGSVLPFLLLSLLSGIYFANLSHKHAKQSDVVQFEALTLTLLENVWSLCAIDIDIQHWNQYWTWIASRGMWYRDLFGVFISLYIWIDIWCA